MNILKRTPLASNDKKKKKLKSKPSINKEGSKYLSTDALDARFGDGTDYSSVSENKSKPAIIYTPIYKMYANNAKKAILTFVKENIQLTYSNINDIVAHISNFFPEQSYTSISNISQLYDKSIDNIIENDDYIIIYNLQLPVFHVIRKQEASLDLVLSERIITEAISLSDLNRTAEEEYSKEEDVADDTEEKSDEKPKDKPEEPETPPKPKTESPKPAKVYNEDEVIFYVDKSDKKIRGSLSEVISISDGAQWVNFVSDDGSVDLWLSSDKLTKE